MQKLLKANSSAKLRELVNRHCAQDFLTWQRDWVWAYDPRLTEDDLPAWIPFDAWPAQEEMARFVAHWIAVGTEGAVVEKSRDQGASTEFCNIFVHRWRYRPGQSFAVASRKLELADKLDDPDALLEKCRNVIRGLPRWMLPRGFDPDEHMRHCLIVNPENGNTITAEGGDEIGRGGRKVARLFDEAASHPHQLAVRKAVTTGQRAIFWLSTPKGMGNEFAKMRFDGKHPVFTLRWQDNPKCDQAWYEQKAEELGELITAQELDLDYTASLEGSCIPAKWVLAAEYDPRDTPAVVWDPDGDTTHARAGLDVADTGAAESVVALRRGPFCFLVRGWHAHTNTTSFRAAAYCQEHGVEALLYDSIGVGAGVTGALNSDDDEDKLGFSVVGVNTGDPPGPGAVDDAPGKPNRERFKNLKAQLWFSLRRRFEKTYQHLNGVKSWPLYEQIRIPKDDSALRVQLSAPVWEYTEDGLLKVESKVHLKARGIERMDRADALVLAYAEVSLGLLI